MNKCIGILLMLGSLSIYGCHTEKKPKEPDLPLDQIDLANSARLLDCISELAGNLEKTEQKVTAEYDSVMQAPIKNDEEVKAFFEQLKNKKERLQRIKEARFHVVFLTEYLEQNWRSILTGRSFPAKEAFEGLRNHFCCMPSFIVLEDGKSSRDYKDRADKILCAMIQNREYQPNERVNYAMLSPVDKFKFMLHNLKSSLELRRYMQKKSPNLKFDDNPKTLLEQTYNATNLLLEYDAKFPHMQSPMKVSLFHSFVQELPRSIRLPGGATTGLYKEILGGLAKALDQKKSVRLNCNDFAGAG